MSQKYLFDWFCFSLFPFTSTRPPHPFVVLNWFRTPFQNTFLKIIFRSSLLTCPGCPLLSLASSSISFSHEDYFRIPRELLLIYRPWSVKTLFPHTGSCPIARPDTLHSLKRTESSLRWRPNGPPPNRILSPSSCLDRQHTFTRWASPT